MGIAETSCVGRTFRLTSLDRPTITPALRERVIGAYQHIAANYSFLTPDIRMGAKITDAPVLNRTGYDEYELNYNSVLLGTMLNSLINGSMIYFGPPGSGKTTTPEIVGQVLFGLTLKQIEQATIYGHTNLTEEKMTASFNIPKLMKGIKEVVWSTWVEQFYRMLDEVNRIPPETTSILMQAVDRRRVSYAGETAEMPWGPIFATANYYDAGNFEMTRPFLDRFGIGVHAEGLSPQHLDTLWRERSENDLVSYKNPSPYDRYDLDLQAFTGEYGNLPKGLADYLRNIGIVGTVMNEQQADNLTMAINKLIQMPDLEKLIDGNKPIADNHQSSQINAELIIANKQKLAAFLPLTLKCYALDHDLRQQILSEIHSISIKRETLAFLVHLASGLSSCDLSGNNWYEKHKGRFGEQSVDCNAEKCGFSAERMVCSQIREQGITSRGMIALRDYSRAFAWFLGKEEVDNEVMKVIFAMVSNHRFSPSKIAMNGGESSDGILIDKTRFIRRTTDFTYHLWELANNGFSAQNPIYAEIDAFYEALVTGGKSREVLLTTSDEILVKVDAMEDPAKWELLKALYEVRHAIRSRG